MDKPNSPWTSHNGSAGDMYETQGAHSVQHQQLPFSNWSTGLNKEQSIWYVMALLKRQLSHIIWYYNVVYTHLVVLYLIIVESVQV